MKIALPFLDKFICSYDKDLPVSDNDKNEQVGTGEIRLENNKYTAELNIDKEEVKKQSFISCKFHKKQNEVLQIEELIISDKKLDSDFSVQLSNVIF